MLPAMLSPRVDTDSGFLILLPTNSSLSWFILLPTILTHPSSLNLVAFSVSLNQLGFQWHRTLHQPWQNLVLWEGDFGGRSACRLSVSMCPWSHPVERGQGSGTGQKGNGSQMQPNSWEFGDEKVFGVPPSCSKQPRTLYSTPWKKDDFGWGSFSNFSKRMTSKGCRLLLLHVQKCLYS